MTIPGALYVDDALCVGVRETLIEREGGVTTTHIPPVEMAEALAKYEGLQYQAECRLDALDPEIEVVVLRAYYVRGASSWTETCMAAR